MSLPRARIYCCGLVTVDLIVENSRVVYAPVLGGSAANVCVALGHLGASASICANVGADYRGDLVVAEFEARGIGTELLQQVPGEKTPFCIEMLQTVDSVYRGHSFAAATETLRSPRFLPVGAATAARLRASLSPGDIVYCSKQIPGIADLAADTGCRLYYEPDCIDDPDLHQILAQRAQVMKLSHGQFIDYARDPFEACAGLAVETFAGEGAAFRVGSGIWNHLPSPPGPAIRDATGAGDWLSAALLHDLASLGIEKFSSEMAAILERGLAMARRSSNFLGALGMEREARLGKDLAYARVWESEGATIFSWIVDEVLEGQRISPPSVRKARFAQ